MATPGGDDRGSSGWERLREWLELLRGSFQRSPIERRPGLDPSRFWAELREGEREAAREADRSSSPARDPIENARD